MGIFGEKIGMHGASIRYMAASLVLFFIICFSPIITVYYNSVQTNNMLAQLQLLFFILLVRESVQEMVSVFSTRREVVVSFFILAFLSMVLLSYFFVSDSGRSFFYISNILFFFALVHLLSKYNGVGFGIIRLKVVSVLLVSFTFLAFLLIDQSSFYSSVAANPPVYRNIRHLNYELMIAMGAVFLLFVSGNLRGFWFFLIFLTFCLISVWSGGRGQLTSLIILLSLTFISKLYKASYLSFLILLISVLLVLVSGESKLLLGQIEATVESSGFDDVSSGRVGIWRDTWAEGLNAGWLGYGADSFRFHEIGPDFIVHPHNSLLQFMFEYGYLGLLLIGLFFFWTGILCFEIIVNGKSTAYLKSGASFLLAMYAYSLVDGIFYHAIPFSFMVFFGAVLFVESRREKYNKGY